MGRRGFSSTWLILLVGFLAVSLVPSCTAAEIKTSATEWSFRLLLPSGVTGAESLAFNARGQGPYTGVSDGRVLNWGGSAFGWTTFAHHTSYMKLPLCTVPVAPSEETESLCGRRLGLAFHHESGDLYIADAYKGLMRVGPDGGEAEVLATGVDGVPFNFINDIDVNQATGDVYFTDNSLTYPRRFNTEIMMNADATGRLLKYDATTKKVTVLKDGLPYPNGVVMSHDRTHVLEAGKYELHADFPGYPDNLRRHGKGGYWVALNQEKERPNTTTAPVKHLVGESGLTETASRWRSSRRLRA
ncbi:hypothetical protein ACQ4PT_020721 [Festuca glaucescens]